MKPVTQTRLHDPSGLSAPGNCWTACIASLLECELAELPDEATFWKPGMTPAESWIPYQKAMLAFLWREHGLTLVEVRSTNVLFHAGVDMPYSILSGPSPRDQQINHAVISRGNEIVHDPHPSRAGLVQDAGPRRYWYEFLVRTCA